jgi:hypothetical protein
MMLRHEDQRWTDLVTDAMYAAREAGSAEVRRHMAVARELKRPRVEVYRMLFDLATLPVYGDGDGWRAYNEGVRAAAREQWALLAAEG